MNKCKAFYLVVVFFFSILLSGIALTGKEVDLKPMNQKTLTLEQKERLLKLAVPFIENRGQYQEAVRFYARTFGGVVFVTKEGEIVYSLPKESGSAEVLKGKNFQTSSQQISMLNGGIALSERLINAKKARIKGVEKTKTKVCIFKGNDPKKWKSGLETYNTVSLGEVYKGIELKLKAYGRNLEKLFYVKPSANVERIRVKIEGGEGIEIAETGELIVKTELGDIRFTKPVAFQEIDGKKQYVEVSYARFSEVEYGFRVGEYDRTKDIVIDPLFASTFLEGSNYDDGYSLAIGENGEVYVTGYTYSANFPTVPGAYDTTNNGNNDVFVSRLDANLTSLEASTFLGGSNYDYGYSLAIGTSGEVYVTGYTSSSDFPTTPGAYDTSKNGGFDIFVSRLNADLTQLDISTFLGGSDDDYGYSLANGTSGDIYVTGCTHSSNFPVTSGAYDTTNNGNNDVFVSRLNANLILLASTFLGGSSSERGKYLAIGANGEIYVTGNTDSLNFPTTTGAYDTSWNGGYDVFDVFVSRLNANLTQLDASTFLGGNENDMGYSLAIGANGEVYVTGYTDSPNFPTTPGAYDSTLNNGNFLDNFPDVFVSRFNANLTQLDASTFLGGTNTDGGYSLAIGVNGEVYVTGYTDSSDFPTTTGAYDTSHNGNFDVFVSRLNADLTQLDVSTFLGGSDYDYGYSLAIGTSSDIYVTGCTHSSNFPVTSGAYDTSWNGGDDVFVSRLDLNLSGPILTVTKTGTGSGTVTSDDGGINCGSDCIETYSSGTAVTLTATRDVGSTFSGWSDDCAACGANPECIIEMNANKSCTAVFNLAVSPQPVPDGTGTTSPVLATKTTSDGSQIQISWDNQCSPQKVNIIYGDLSSVANYTVSGSKCGISNPDTWDIGSTTNIWFVLVSDNLNGTESSWGLNSQGQQRNGDNASGQCGNNLRDNSGTCP